VDWFLAAVIGVVLILLFFINTYLVVSWADPQDQHVSLWQTVLIITALTLAEGAILCLPLDVANNSNALDCTNDWAQSSADCGNLDMAIFWQVMICFIFIYVVGLLPMAIFHYEAYDEVEIRGKRTDNRQACCSAIFYESMVLVATFLTLGLMYAFMGVAQVPYTSYKVDVGADGYVWGFTAHGISTAVDISTEAGLDAFRTSGNLESGQSCLAGCVQKGGGRLEIRTSFAIYIAALTGWVGWFFFVFFGGIGLAALPGDLIRHFVDRPTIKSVSELETEKKDIQRRTNELIKLGTEIKKEREDWAAGTHTWRENRKKKSADRQNVNKFKQMVFMLENNFESWEISCGQQKDYNPLLPYISLCFGVLSAIITLLWILHIILYMLVDPPATPFLNLYFVQFDGWFPLFGILSVAMFAGYLLICVIAGLFKVGVRCMCITLHPMRYGRTLMNSFMFNTMWILICALPVVQFCTDAFEGYARYTTIATLLGVQVSDVA
jgi:LMBR1 domain-containing protein 1